jgi:hypothetical protein
MIAKANKRMAMKGIVDIYSATSLQMEPCGIQKQISRSFLKHGLKRIKTVN